MELRQYASIFRRWLWLIAAFTIMAALFGYLVTRFMPITYEASTTLLVNQAQPLGTTTYSDVSASQQLTKTYGELAIMRPVLETTIAELKLPYSPEQLSRMLSVQAVRDTLLLQLKVSSDNPQQAADIADTVAKAFIEETRRVQIGRAALSQGALEQQLRALEEDIRTTTERLATLQSASDAGASEPSDGDITRLRLENTLAQHRVVYSELLKNEQDMRLAESRAYSSISVVQPAVVDPAPVSPRPLQYVLIAAVLGLVLGLMVALAVESLDDTVRDNEDVLAALRVPAIGHVTRVDPADVQSLGSLTKTGSPPPALESFRVLNTNIQYSTLDHPGKVMLISSANQSEGKSLTAINLARVNAQMGKRVILVDADLRRPSIHRYLHLANNHGVTSALLDPTSLESGALQPSGLQNLTVMPSGPLPPDPSQLLASPRMADLVKSLKGKADLVLVDSPPLLEVSDPIIISALVDAVLLVVDSTRTKAATLVRVREMLEYSTGSYRLLGAVLNKLKPGAEGHYYRSYSPVHSANGKVGLRKAVEMAGQALRSPGAEENRQRAARVAATAARTISTLKVATERTVGARHDVGGRLQTKESGAGWAGDPGSTGHVTPPGVVVRQDGSPPARRRRPS